MTSLNPVHRIGRQIAETLRLHLKLSRKVANESAVTLLTQVGIPDPELRAQRLPGPAERRDAPARDDRDRARVRARAPLADEPTTGLDVTIQAQILDLLAELQRMRRMAMIFVTHDLGIVATRTDRIMVMYAGPRRRDSRRPPTLFANVRMPYTEALLNSTPTISNPSHTRLEAIDGRPPDLVAPARRAARSRRAAATRRTSAAEESPPLVADAGEPDHFYACWHPRGVHAAWPSARARSPVVDARRSPTRAAPRRCRTSASNFTSGRPHRPGRLGRLVRPLPRARRWGSSASRAAASRRPGAPSPR